MLRRWRLEIADHEYGLNVRGFRNYASYDQAPLPPIVCDDSCHCYLGPGFFRKRHPRDCGRPRCGLCSYGKNYEPKRRAAIQRVALAYELAAV
jgi:hypothetical protein